MYSISEVEPMIVAEWRRWSRVKGSYSTGDMLEFFSTLQTQNSHLLAFRCSGDKWQRVHSWLLRDEDEQSRLRNA